MLGFERKARLFCDNWILNYPYRDTNRWDLSVRLGYFVTSSDLTTTYLKSHLLGFERKARLFCDNAGRLCGRLY